MSDYETRFGAIGRLYGTDGLARIRKAHVCVIGLGGVGSWVVEALARSGIGALTLVDMDEVCLSNVNRQVHALDGAVGRTKASVLAERVGQIAPECVVTVEEVFFTESTADRLLTPVYDYIIDAIDATRHKCMLIAEARQRGLKLITCGGAGGCIDPSRVRICDLARTINDPLLLQVRKRLRQQYGFPKFKRQKFKIDCVYSDELPVFPASDGSVSCEREAGEDYRLNCDTGFGSATYLTGTVGFFLAAEVIKRIALTESTDRDIL
ncbi:MAG TPA: tRNA cyclic N6-threonylcarbamoyladenosine(37) synthase TcdA [Opitutae bacterium]|nr:tRNA cyclic N6-threonylcarbamoyladenosine(37) synthase TcdA [Puniceicoccaceae bacterium]HBR92843.1 tRNA cyclic N6-threonylcarbamoyladenosine(37) synthase TcdA [Opitutae bacterium]|tara:strand:- start:927 stop:1724 length:798 start_codon:yes stop_codon:yes gene_type:complete